MRLQDVKDIEIELFLDAMRLRHGYDFSNYSRASLKRRILGLLPALGFDRIVDMLPSLLYEHGFHLHVISLLSVPVSEMFRNPEVFLSLRKKVAPVLQSYPQINIWVAGCATGEEVYSLAILLKEENLYDRTQIYATDINDAALAKAEEGVYPVKLLKDYAGAYLKAGGAFSLENYYQSLYDFGMMDSSLKKNIVFAHHNLVADGVFCEVNMILCRNVLIYFDRYLQGRVLHLLRDSFARGGFLCLGNKESLEFSDVAVDFKTIDFSCRIYQCVPNLPQTSWSPDDMTSL
ncbi:putative methyltransferase Cher3 [Azospirillaceae bacterium]